MAVNLVDYPNGRTHGLTPDDAPLLAAHAGRKAIQGDALLDQSVIPQLRITDASRSVPFYVDGLGFAVDWKHQFEAGYPLFLQLTRAGQTIFLTEHKGDCQVGGAVYFKVPDVDDCFRDFSARGIVLVQEPEDTEWGTRELLVTDPDGNRLRFATHDAT